MAYEKGYSILETLRILKASEGKKVVGGVRVPHSYGGHALGLHVASGGKRSFSSTSHTTVQDMEVRFDAVNKATGAFRSPIEMAASVSFTLNSIVGQAALKELDAGAQHVWMEFKYEPAFIGFSGIEQLSTTYTVDSSRTDGRSTTGSTTAQGIGTIALKLMPLSNNTLHLQTAFAKGTAPPASFFKAKHSSGWVNKKETTHGTLITF